MDERDRVPPVVSPRNWPARVATVLLTMLAVPDRLWADQEHQVPTFRHRAVVRDDADLTYNPCNDVRVFRYVLPGRDHRYVMLLMGSNRGTRRIYLAWSKDGRSWESRRTPLLDPPVGTNQIAQMSPCLLLGNGRIYMDTSVGPSLQQKIAVAMAETPERAAHVAFVAEMEEVAELAMVADGQRWSRQQEAAWSDHVACARAAWKQEAETLPPELTVDRVRSLSRWAKPQMQQYSAVPALADVVLEPIGVDKQSVKLVLEGTVATLPSHHPIVTGWLTVYVVYDIPARKIHSTGPGRLDRNTFLPQRELRMSGKLATVGTFSTPTEASKHPARSFFVITVTLHEFICRSLGINPTTRLPASGLEAARRPARLPAPRSRRFGSPPGSPADWC